MRIHLIALGLLNLVCVLGLRAQTADSVAIADSLPPAPPPKPLKLGVSLTGSSYRGDLDNQTFNFTRFYPGINFSIELEGKKRLRLQFNAGYGQFAEEFDENTQLTDTAGASLPNGFQGVVPFVQTSFFYTDFRLRGRLAQLGPLELFAGTGVGFLMFSPRDKNGKFLSETYLNRERSESYNTLVAQFPLNIGFQYRFSPQVAVGLDYTYRLTPTDYLDNLGKLGQKQGNDALHTLAATVCLSIKDKPKLPEIFHQQTQELQPMEPVARVEDVMDALLAETETTEAADDHPPLEAEDPEKMRLLAGFFPTLQNMNNRKVEIPGGQVEKPSLDIPRRKMPLSPKQWMGVNIEDESPEFGYAPTIDPIGEVAENQPEMDSDPAAGSVIPHPDTEPETLPQQPQPTVAATTPARVLTAIEEAALKAVANDDVMYYHPKRGDKLAQLSERFHVPIEAIRIANGLPPTATSPVMGIYLKLPDLRKYYDPPPTEENP